jgi:hypothetical protein
MKDIIETMDKYKITKELFIALKMKSKEKCMHHGTFRKPLLVGLFLHDRRAILNLCL